MEERFPGIRAGDDGLEAGDPGRVIRQWFQRHGDGEAGPRAPARLPVLSGAGPRN